MYHVTTEKSIQLLSGVGRSHVIRNTRQNNNRILSKIYMCIMVFELITFDNIKRIFNT